MTPIGAAIVDRRDDRQPEREPSPVNGEGSGVWLENRLIDDEEDSEEGGDDIAGKARDVAAHGKEMQAGVRGDFAARILAAKRSGLPASQIAAIIRGIIEEMKGAEMAARETTSRGMTALKGAPRRRTIRNKKPRKRPHSPKHH